MNDSTTTQQSPGRIAVEEVEAHLDEVRGRHPAFFEAVIADAKITAAYRGERHEFRSRLDGALQVVRLMMQTDAFFALAAYRLKAHLQARGVPVLPWIAHRLAITFGQISIADAVVVQPGVFIPNGQVVIYGLTEVQPGASLSPWSRIGPIGTSVSGPKIGPGAVIGAGAKIMGEIEVGPLARVGANSVVLDDVPARTTVVGMPARPVEN